MSVTTDTLGLEKPLLNENYDIDVHNRNMDKIDEDLKPIDDSYIIELFQHDGDTTNPRDYYTKVEADEKFATKEEVENIDLSNLATKGEVENALNKANESFQRGDNVKTQLVDKLISEGLNVSTNNTFEELIGNIALGKKWASGTGVQTDLSIGNDYRVYLSVKGLDFEPSVIIFFTDLDNIHTTEKMATTVYCKNNLIPAQRYIVGGNGTVEYITDNYYDPLNYVKYGEFYLRVSNYGNRYAINYLWYAYE